MAEKKIDSGDTPGMTEAEALLAIQEQMDMTFQNVKQVVLVLRNRNLAFEKRIAEVEARLADREKTIEMLKAEMAKAGMTGATDANLAAKL